MRSSLAWRLLRDARYALPHWVGRTVPAPDARAAARLCERLHRRGLAVAVGYFEGASARPEDIVAAYGAVAARLTGPASQGAYLSVKAPPLDFCEAHLRELADTAQAAGLSLMFDAHGPEVADRTLDAAERLLSAFPGTGCVLPARWRRSLGDAARFRDSSAPIRIVRGEWPDPDRDEEDIEADYLALVSALAGRQAPVAVATHRPVLAERALALLQDAGTPCELEQLRGLPRRRTVAVARRAGVPVRVYVPFGPGWWPYAVDKALARPYLLSWMARDLLGLRGG